MTNVVQFPPSSNGDENPFEKIKRMENGTECWYARELMPLLGYEKWERFIDALDRARLACQNTGLSVDNHFANAGFYTRGVPSDYKLSRYACYLTAMNGDSRKPEIASAQTYFAIKTHQAEEREKQEQQQASAVSNLEIAESMMALMQHQFAAVNALINANKEAIARISQAEQKIEELRESTVINSDAIASIQEVQEKAKSELERIDLPELPAKGISDRKKITWIVNTYVRATNASHADVWRTLYEQFLLRYGINLKVRASNATADRKKKVDRLDILEELKMCGDFYSMAYELLINQPA